MTQNWCRRGPEWSQNGDKMGKKACNCTKWSPDGVQDPFPPKVSGIFDYFWLPFGPPKSTQNATLAENGVTRTGCLSILVFFPVFWQASKKRVVHVSNPGGCPCGSWPISSDQMGGTSESSIGRTDLTKQRARTCPNKKALGGGRGVLGPWRP